MSIFAEKKRIEKLNFDIDLRIYGLMLDILDQEEMTPEQIVPYLRASYGKGYSDALIEDAQDQKGLLLKEHYLKTPGI